MRGLTISLRKDNPSEYYKLADEMRRRKGGSTYLLNKLIDQLIHPLYKQSAGWILVDGALHALVEQDLRSSTRKFVKYSLPLLIRRRGRACEKSFCHG